ncbi:MAG TPA: hypothetical protein ENG50_04485 [Candidatus Altiarchaeales archaeon]|nr:hypothetical protein [Candidatus Altiarchaeales archaeon]
MSKITSKGINSTIEIDLLKRFKELDLSDFPDFYSYKNPLEKGLWVLWVAKDRLGVKKLTAEDIAMIIRDVMEISISAKSITKSFNRARDKIHTYKEDGRTYFEIMKPGKVYLISQIKEGSINIFYFEPDKRYTSKRVLSRNILSGLKDELKIVDPYCGERTLDVLSTIKDKSVKFLTRIENLKEKQCKRFLRELQDFKLEHPNMEFRSYPYTDIHDRYVISSELLVILGCSIKDLGGKESFAIVLNKDANKNIVEALIENFNRRWKQSKPI